MRGDRCGQTQSCCVCTSRVPFHHIRQTTEVWLEKFDPVFIFLFFALWSRRLTTTSSRISDIFVLSLHWWRIVLKFFFLLLVLSSFPRLDVLLGFWWDLNVIILNHDNWFVLQNSPVLPFKLFLFFLERKDSISSSAALQMKMRERGKLHCDLQWKGFSSFKNFVFSFHSTQMPVQTMKHFNLIIFIQQVETTIVQAGWRMWTQLACTG